MFHYAQFVAVLLALDPRMNNVKQHGETGRMINLYSDNIDREVVRFCR